MFKPKKVQYDIDRVDALLSALKAGEIRVEPKINSKGEVTNMFTKIEKDLKEAINQVYGIKSPTPTQCAILMNTGMSLLADIKCITQETAPWATGWNFTLEGSQVVGVDNQSLMAVIDSWKAALRPDLQYEKVIFNGPATIVFWKDGTKTVVKCRDEGEYDREKGLAMCFMKRVVGDSFHNILAKEVYNTEKKYISCFLSTGIKSDFCEGKGHEGKNGKILLNKKCEKCPYFFKGE